MLINVMHEGRTIAVNSRVHAAGVNGGYIVAANVPLSGPTGQGHFRWVTIAGPFLTMEEANAAQVTMRKAVRR